ncbi:MAG: amidohydrolase family protein [Alphaproteobacteria bacterium]|nr:amidohydrolase family protein [Alphaproteobacteria bacterium]
MRDYRLISADSHIVEPPDLYTSRIDPKFRDRAPRMERRRTPTGRDYDAWMLDGAQVGTLGAVMQAGQRFEDPSQIDFLGVWEDVRKGGYDPHAMIEENEEDGVWGSVLQPSQGLFWYRIPDTQLLSAICAAYNDWIADFCKPRPDRLKGIAMLNVDDVDEACQELERCKQLGLVGAFIPVAPLADRPYRHPIYERLWWTAQDAEMPLLLHIGTPRHGVPANEFTTDLSEMSGAGRSTTDYWVRYSLGAMLFAGVFDRYPRLRLGSVEHEASWIPHWLKQMDFTYVERPVFTKGWKSREGMLPSDYWRRNMFVEFMEDDLGVQLRERIGVENMLWGSDYPHAEATWPKSQQFLERMFAGVPSPDLRKITSENAAKMFGFAPN